jgi:ABC-2 type transport system permease protein
MSNFLNQIKYEFRIFLQNSTLRMVFFLGPIIYAFLFAFVYKEGKLTNLPVIVVDKDNTPTSNQLIEMLQNNEGIKIVFFKYDNTNLQKEIIKQNASLLLIIPERFEADILQKRYPELVTYINTANLVTANFSTKSMQATLATFSAGIAVKALQKRGMAASFAATQYEPFKANYIRLYNETGNYFLFMWPALLAVILQQVILLAMAISFATAFSKTNFATDFSSKNKSVIGLILVKVLPVWFFCIVHLCFFYLLHHLFHAPVPQGIFNYALISALFIAAASFMGVFVSVLLPDALKATQVLMLVSTPAFIIGGFTWPSSAMPLAIQYLASIIPLTPFLQAFKILLVQDGDLMDTLPFLKHLTILVMLYGFLSYLSLKIKIMNELKNREKEVIS